MIRLISVLFVFILCFTAFKSCAPGEENLGKDIRILVTYGGHNFEQEPFYGMFDSLPGISYTSIQLPDSADLLKPGLEKSYDVIVMYDMVDSISEKQRKAFVALLREGIGIVALHHNLAAHKNWDEYRKIIGGIYLFESQILDGKERIKSSYSHDQDIKVTVTDKNHPITRGISDFQIHDETYKDYFTSKDARVLLTTDHPMSDPELAWITRYQNSPVFYLLLGHDSQAWQNPVYPRLLLNGIRWAAQ